MAELSFLNDLDFPETSLDILRILFLETNF